MLSPSLTNALRAAVRLNEIGRGTPYEVSFARKGKSGASFGFMQGDLAAGQPEVRDAFRQCLSQANFSAGEIADLIARLGVPCPRNPLTTGEETRIDAALVAGRAIVDAMDTAIFAHVARDVEHCLAVAQAAGRTISDGAVLYIGMWINMTGAPTKMLRWLSGEDPQMARTPPPPGNPVGTAAIQGYLRATPYFTQNPQNFDHMIECVSAGLAALG